jgi:2'-5' RNA ligase
MSVTVRTFVAVPLPEKVRATVFEAAQSLARELPAVRWSRKVENLHVTIKFLGAVEADRLDGLGAELAGPVGALPRFEIELRGMGAFPGARRANVVWAGIEDRAGGLARIAETVEAVTARLGLGEREARPFRAHVTVGRCRAGIDARRALEAWRERRFGRVSVDAVHVYESRLGGEGSTYVLRARALLGRSDSN